MKNYVELLGHLANDPTFYEEDETESGVNSCEFVIECEQEVVEEVGGYGRAFFDCYAVDAMASFICERFIQKMPIHLSGRLYMRVIKDEDDSYEFMPVVLVEKAKQEGEDRRELAENGEPIDKTPREERLKRRAAGVLMREQFGAPSWDDLFTKEELASIPSDQHYTIRKQREKEWYDKKGIPDPFSLVSDDEIINLTIDELHSVLSERTGDWFVKASEEQMKITEKNLGRYFLEQRTIPERLFLGDGKLFIAGLTKQGDRTLYSLLVIKENLRIGGGYKCPYSPEQFVIKHQWMRTTDNDQDLGMVVIQMPEPESVPLCSFLIICHDAKIERIQYYTVEKAIGRGHFVLCGVNERGSHLNYGDAPETLNEIVERVRKMYSQHLAD